MYSFRQDENIPNIVRTKTCKNIARYKEMDAYKEEHARTLSKLSKVIGNITDQLYEVAELIIDCRRRMYMRTSRGDELLHLYQRFNNKLIMQHSNVKEYVRLAEDLLWYLDEEIRVRGIVLGSAVTQFYDGNTYIQHEKHIRLLAEYRSYIVSIREKAANNSFSSEEMIIRVAREEASHRVVPAGFLRLPEVLTLGEWLS